MAKLLKLRRGSTSQHSSFTGAEGEVTVDTDKDVLVVNDGSTAGGHPLAAEDMSNVSSASIAGRLATDSIATTKIAAGALPTDVTVASANIVNGTIVNEDVNASAAIAGTKVSPDFGSQNVVTTGDVNCKDITLTDTQPTITFTDSNHDPDFLIRNADGGLIFNDSTNGANRLVINSDGHVDITGNLDAEGGVDVTGNITVTGTVDGIDVAASDTLMRSVVASSANLNNGVTATTQSASDNSTKVATTAYTDTAIANLVDSSPGALNTLNELAAAINDDASFSTTITNSIATKMPLSGGTFTGSVIVGNGGTSVSDANLVVSADDAGAAIMLQRSGSGRFDCSVANEGGSLVFRTGLDSSTVAGLTNRLSINGNTGTVTAAGTMAATTFSGSGASLTNIPAANITGTLPAIDGSNLTGIVSIPAGMIMIWSGAANAIPSGFTLCDGNNSTPDLRDRFVVGAQNAYNVGNTGGATSGSDTVNISFSVSGTTGGPSTTGAAGGFQTSIGARENHTHSFSGSGSDSDTVTIATLPPYYALCYVMKT